MAAFVDAGDCPVRVRDPGNHRGELQIFIRDMQGDETATLNLSEIEGKRLPVQEMR